MKCVSCGKSIPDDSAFCSYCGEKQAVICPECGAQLPVDAVFCHKCGQKISAAGQTKLQETESVSAPFYKTWIAEHIDTAERLNIDWVSEFMDDLAIVHINGEDNEYRVLKKDGDSYEFDQIITCVLKDLSVFNYEVSEKPEVFPTGSKYAAFQLRNTGDLRFRILSYSGRVIDSVSAKYGLLNQMIVLNDQYYLRAVPFREARGMYLNVYDVVDFGTGRAALESVYISDLCRELFLYLPSGQINKADYSSSLRKGRFGCFFTKNGKVIEGDEANVHVIMARNCDSNLIKREYSGHIDLYDDNGAKIIVLPYVEDDTADISIDVEKYGVRYISFCKNTDTNGIIRWHIASNESGRNSSAASMISFETGDLSFSSEGCADENSRFVENNGHYYLVLDIGGDNEQRLCCDENLDIWFDTSKTGFEESEFYYKDKVYVLGTCMGFGTESAVVYNISDHVEMFRYPRKNFYMPCECADIFYAANFGGYEFIPETSPFSDSLVSGGKQCFLIHDGNNHKGLIDINGAVIIRPSAENLAISNDFFGVCGADLPEGCFAVYLLGSGMGKKDDYFRVYDNSGAIIHERLTVDEAEKIYPRKD